MDELTEQSLRGLHHTDEYRQLAAVPADPVQDPEAPRKRSWLLHRQRRPEDTRRDPSLQQPTQTSSDETGGCASAWGSRGRKQPARERFTNFAEPGTGQLDPAGHPIRTGRPSGAQQATVGRPKGSTIQSSQLQIGGGPQPHQTVRRRSIQAVPIARRAREAKTARLREGSDRAGTRAA